MFCTDMYIRDGLHLRGKSAAVFADELSTTLTIGLVYLSSNINKITQTYKTL